MRDGSAAEGGVAGTDSRIGSGVGGDGTSATRETARCITAPEALGLDTRLTFRESVTRALDAMPDGSVLTVDLSRTTRVDSAGLSALMLIQRHASDRGQRVVLRDPSEELRFLLALTLMTDLFEISPSRS